MRKCRGSILVVDDDKTIHESCGRVLCEEGYEVDTALSGKGALQKLKEKLYDLILLDIRMADMDGIKTLEEMKKKTPDISVVMFTGYPSIETIRDSMKLGAFDYLSKPFTPSELLHAVEEAIKQKKSPQRILRSIRGFKKGASRKITAASIMRTKMVTCDSTSTIKEVVKTMVKNNVRSVLVRQDGNITGIIVDTNILNITAKEKDLSKIKASDIMSFPLECCDANDDLERCMELFRETGHSRLVVMKEGQIVGILLRKFAERFLNISKRVSLAEISQSPKFRTSRW